MKPVASECGFGTGEGVGESMCLLWILLTKIRVPCVRPPPSSSRLARLWSG